MYSLVTACMNREAHLRENLPHWLRLPGLAEVVVVDWSNARPLTDLTAIDPRVRIVRVVEEPHWVLSYAYNVGVAHASSPEILKCDADCRPSASIGQYRPNEHAFRAGYWRTGAAVGKPSVNGQCFFLKRQFDAVNGYSEIIRTYGRDDEDFYDRLIAAGFARQEIPPSELDFVEHTQAERTSNQPSSNQEHPFFSTTGFREMRNCFLAQALPWTTASARAPFEVLEQSAQSIVLRRDRAREIQVPPEAEAAARLRALRYFVCREAGVAEAAAQRLDERACLAVIVGRLYRPRAAVA